MTSSPVILRRSPRPVHAGRLTRREGRAVWGLCSLYSFGILGLYMALPVLAPYARTLRGQSNLLIGLSVGAYGLTQTLFQMPFGALSDRIGRKQAIFIGLVLFAAGGVICALSHQIWGLIVGRLIQGVGAMVSSVVSLLADLTRPGVRTQAMARFGIAIGVAFGGGVVLGPLAAHRLGVPALFWITSAVSLAAGLYLLFAIPAPRFLHPEERTAAKDLPGILRDRRLLLLDLGTLLTHAVVAILFVHIPSDLAQRPLTMALWKIALPVGAVGLAAMIASARLADRRNRSTSVLYSGTVALVLSCALFALAPPRSALTLAALLAFILAEALLEPALPALMTRLGAGEHRGAATGAFHMSQFLGTFAGGLLGGAFLTRSRTPLFAGLGLIMALWLLALVRTGRWQPARTAAPQES
jgi:MFS family permease